MESEPRSCTGSLVSASGVWGHQDGQVGQEGLHHGPSQEWGRRARAAVGRCGCCSPQAFTALSAEGLLPGQDAQPWEKLVRLHVLSLTTGCHCLLGACPGTSYFVPGGVISFRLRSFLLDICKDTKGLVLETGNISKSRFKWGKERWEALKNFKSPWQCGLVGWRVVLYTKKSRV